MLDSKRGEIQDSAVATWDKTGRKGTINLSTGIGKTFCFIKATRLLPKGSSILFLAETSQREFDLEKDIKFFKKLYGYDLKSVHNLTFMCYQSSYKLTNTTWDLVCADEIHMSLTPQYTKFYKNNVYKHILGLSATVDRTTKYLDEEGNEIINDEEPLKSIYTADLYHATIKVLQECMSKIESQQAQIEELKALIK